MQVIYGLYALKDYSKIKDLIHSNITGNIDYYREGNICILPEYHGCGLRNGNGFKQRIDYSRGYQCVLPPRKAYWRRIKQKYELQRVYNIRSQSQYNNRYSARVKGYYY